MFLIFFFLSLSREHLWKFFFPADYQPLQPTRDPSPGERRQYKAFEFRMSIIAKATVDILFTKNSVSGDSLLLPFTLFCLLPSFQKQDVNYEELIGTNYAV